MVALAAAYGAGAAGLPSSGLDDPVGAAGLPLALAGILVLLGAWVALRAGVALARGRTPAADAETRPGPARAVAILGVAAAYAVAAPLVGYPAAIAAAIAGCAVVSGARAGLRTGLVAVVLAALFWIGFVKVLGTPQPAAALLRAAGA